MLFIESIARGSLAERVGLRSGDRVAQVNGAPVRDILDFHFHVDDEPYLLSIDRAGESFEQEIVPEDRSELGIVFRPMKTRLCGNDCIFCFTYQNPEDSRKTLFVKDEDYRLSFLHGNFVTLANMKEWEVRRVVEQRLSPIYISIHSTNRVTRQKMIRARKERDIMPILDYFAENEITMHTQVVLVPGYNDGEDLKQTVRDLAAYYPQVQSLAVVPLGMTEHRASLPSLRPVTMELAQRTLAEMRLFQDQFLEQWGIRFVYMADEWYRMLDREVPPETHYDGFPQIENGIGMTREFLNRLGRKRKLFPDAEAVGMRRATLVTGTLFRPKLEMAVRKKLDRTREPVQVEVIGVRNQYFGDGVTVAGLLVGRDILDALKGVEIGDRLYLPPHVLNDDDLFLDDTMFSEFAQTVGKPVQVGFQNRHW